MSTSSPSGGNFPTRSTHRYLDIMTVRPSQGARPSSPMQFRPFTAQNVYSTPAPGFSTINNLNASLLVSGSSNNAEPVQAGGRATASGTRSRATTARNVITPATAASSTVSATAAAGGSSGGPAHGSLLIEPILLPNMQHVHVDSQQDLEESCLFYPTGHKNKNIRREIENSVIKHHIIENSRMVASKKQKTIYRIVRPDPYANAKGPPLVYTKKDDPQVTDVLQRMHSTRGKMTGLVQIRL